MSTGREIDPDWGYKEQIQVSDDDDATSFTTDRTPTPTSFLSPGQSRASGLPFTDTFSPDHESASLPTPNSNHGHDDEGDNDSEDSSSDTASIEDQELQLDNAPAIIQELNFVLMELPALKEVIVDVFEEYADEAAPTEFRKWALSEWRKLNEGEVRRGDERLRDVHEDDHHQSSPPRNTRRNHSQGANTTMGLTSQANTRNDASSLSHSRSHSHSRSYTTVHPTYTSSSNLRTLLLRKSFSPSILSNTSFLRLSSTASEARREANEISRLERRRLRKLRKDIGPLHLQFEDYSWNVGLCWTNWKRLDESRKSEDGRRDFVDVFEKCLGELREIGEWLVEEVDGMVRLPFTMPYPFQHVREEAYISSDRSSYPGILRYTKENTNTSHKHAQMDIGQS
ncbi:hypothetical protein BT69DRAFT_1335061 [Atractiella rhizophila]|nr:hypothetical protein BT69DRAFT_1335061 [Atractiella rhizophila]